jgi:hypothetical protein
MTPTTKDQPQRSPPQRGQLNISERSNGTLGIRQGLSNVLSGVRVYSDPTRRQTRKTTLTQTNGNARDATLRTTNPSVDSRTRQARRLGQQKHGVGSERGNHIKSIEKRWKSIRQPSEQRALYICDRCPKVSAKR